MSNDNTFRSDLDASLEKRDSIGGKTSGVSTRVAAALDTLDCDLFRAVVGISNLSLEEQDRLLFHAFQEDNLGRLVNPK